MAMDIGYTLFVQLLGMTMYPGSPFTGNIYRDLIMFLIVPTIFIIMVLYMLTGRIIPDRKMRIMLGVGAFLFIIASGFYPVFALLAGPYFIFLIFILGILGYLTSHFRGHSRGAPPTFSSSMGGGYSEGDDPTERTMSDIEKKIRDCQHRLNRETSDKTREMLTRELMRLEHKKEELKRERTNPNKYR